MAEMDKKSNQDLIDKLREERKLTKGEWITLLSTYT